MEFVTRVFPGKTDFLDLKDTLAADLMKRALQVDQNFSGIAGGGPAGCFANMTQLALGLSTYVKRRRQAARGDFATDVSRGGHRGHHQRRACWDVDFASVSAAL